MVPDNLQPRGAPLYAKNPLYQTDAHDSGRVVQYTGFAEMADRDGNTFVRSAAEAGTFPFARKPEDALAPFLESLRLVQGDPMYRAISAQMESLYQVFKDLHEQDQAEIRKLLLALESQKQQLHQLASENDGVRQQLLARERELAAAALAAAAAKQLARDQQQQLAPGTVGLVAGRQRASTRMSAGLNQPEELHDRSYDSGDTAPNGPGLSGRSSVTQQRSSHRPGAAGREAMEAPLPATAPASSRTDGGSSGSDRRDRPVAKRGRREYFILFLPYMLHPAHHCWRFYAAWQYSWSTRRTMWLAAAWVLVFLLAVGLLVGLLVPWKRMGATSFTMGPEVVAVGASSVSLVMQLNREAAVYYVVVPAAATAGAPGGRRRLTGDHAASALVSGRPSDSGVRKLGFRIPYWHRAMPWRPPQLTSARRGRSLAGVALLQLNDVEADDVQDMAKGSVGTDGSLYPYTIACGLVDVPLKRTNYTLTVSNGVPSPGLNSSATAAAAGECTGSFGMALNGVWPIVSNGPFFERRCQRCPVILPGTAYVALLFGDGGRRTGIAQVRFTTLAASPPPPVSTAA